MKTDVRREPPREMGDETEFFLQRTEPLTRAFVAHIHTAAELLYIREGSYTISLDDVQYEVYPGDLILFCSGAIHHGAAGDMPKNSYYVMKIPPSLFIGFSKREIGAEAGMRFAFNHASRRCLWRDSELVGSEIKSVLDGIVREYEEGRYASEIAIRLKMMELLIAILRDEESVSSRAALSDSSTEQIYYVMDAVSRRYAEDIDERALARECGMSYCYFSRSFRRVTGMTFKSYLNRIRISKAERLLFRNQSTISEVASACGYNSVSYFISVYRSLTGKTPYQTIKAETAAKEDKTSG